MVDPVPPTRKGDNVAKCLTDLDDLSLTNDDVAYLEGHYASGRARRRLHDERLRMAILAVKPQIANLTMLQLASRLPPSVPVVSVMAGVTLASMSEILGNDRPLVRVMPNTPALIQEGFSVACANDLLDADDRELLTFILEGLGRHAFITDESLMDAVTAVSGSGPAYLFLLAEAMFAAAVKQGLPVELAQDMIKQTLKGAGILADISGASFAKLRENVTSPGGTTHAALEVFNQNAEFHDLVAAAINAAARRSHELGNPAD